MNTRITTPANFLDPRLPSRFWNKCMPCPVSGCWLWFGATSNGGYGFFGSGRRSIGAHRAAYEAFAGEEIEDGMEADHLCKNTLCCNPAHIEIVSHLENIRRSANTNKPACVNGHPYTDADFEGANGWRKCQVCVRARGVAKAAKAKIKRAELRANRLPRAACRRGHEMIGDNVFLYRGCRRCRSCYEQNVKKHNNKRRHTKHEQAERAG